ncbi:hypothetical protein [Roseateles chitosanitabidus]|uniref:hypothetical protein n=1 Tax=Roseateles chitosanitabidus TaxID=65048 RepID=UPI001471244D|nr:hypothetical protein [Roseateles chitosanitabidus]
MNATVESKAASDAKQTVQTQFSHFYKVMGGTTEQPRNALEMLQRKSEPTTSPTNQKR